MLHIRNKKNKGAVKIFHGGHFCINNSIRMGVPEMTMLKKFIGDDDDPKLEIVIVSGNESEIYSFTKFSGSKMIVEEYNP